MPRFYKRKYPQHVTPRGHQKYAVCLVDMILHDYKIGHLPTVIRPRLKDSYIKTADWGVGVRLGNQHLAHILHHGFKERRDTAFIWAGLDLVGYSGLWANSIHLAAHALNFKRNGATGKTHGPNFWECLEELFFNYAEFWKDYKVNNGQPYRI